MDTLNYENCKVVFLQEDGDENVFGNFIIKYDGFSEELPFVDVIELNGDDAEYCIDSDVEADFFVENIPQEDIYGNFKGFKVLLTLK